MNMLARLIGWLSARFARVMLRWAETRYGPNAVRLFVYSNILALPDEPALVGVEGKRRGHAPMSPADLAVALDLWQHCAADWTVSELARRRHIVLDSWKPARQERPVRRLSSR